MFTGKLLIAHYELLYLLQLQVDDVDVTLEIKIVESVCRENDLAECMQAVNLELLHLSVLCRIRCFPKRNADFFLLFRFSHYAKAVRAISEYSGDLITTGLLVAESLVVFSLQ